MRTLPDPFDLSWQRLYILLSTCSQPPTPLLRLIFNYFLELGKIHYSQLMRMSWGYWHSQAPGATSQHRTQDVTEAGRWPLSDDCLSSGCIARVSSALTLLSTQWPTWNSLTMISSRTICPLPRTSPYKIPAELKDWDAASLVYRHCKKCGQR